MRVGVVGAGLSGLLCAQRLSELVPGGLRISVLEWGRGPGGRTARRRVTTQEGGELSYDHAAPYFTATTDAFRELLARWQEAGAAAPWPGAGTDVWVGTASSNAIARHVVTQLEGAGASMLFGNHVLAAKHDGAVWRVRTQQRATDTTSELIFDALVLSDKLLVLPNTYSVLAPPDVGPLALPSSLTSTAAVVLLIALQPSAASTLSSSGLPPATTVVDCSKNHPQQQQQQQQHGGGTTAAPILSRVIHESAKPGRRTDTTYDQWVVHSTAEYAELHLVGEALDNEAAVLAEMQEAFLELLLGGGSADTSADAGAELRQAVAHAR